MRQERNEIPAKLSISTEIWHNKDESGPNSGWNLIPLLSHSGKVLVQSIRSNQILLRQAIIFPLEAPGTRDKQLLIDRDTVPVAHARDIVAGGAVFIALIQDEPVFLGQPLRVFDKVVEMCIRDSPRGGGVASFPIAAGIPSVAFSQGEL